MQAILGGIFCLEYPSRRTEKVNCHFVNYKLSFRKLHIFISQTTDFHFANYRFSFPKLQTFISQTTNFKPNHPFFFDFGIHYTCSFPPLHFSHFFFCNIFYKARPVATVHAVTDCLLLILSEQGLSILAPYALQQASKIKLFSVVYLNFKFPTHPPHRQFLIVWFFVPCVSLWSLWNSYCMGAVSVSNMNSWVDKSSGLLSKE